jgi:hypothetical protein
MSRAQTNNEAWPDEEIRDSIRSLFPAAEILPVAPEGLRIAHVRGFFVSQGDSVALRLPGRYHLTSRGDPMSLLRPKEERASSNLRTYTVIRCPFNGHQVGWCRRLCQPVEGRGACGRPAPHAMVGRYQAAIASCNAKLGP